MKFLLVVCGLVLFAGILYIYSRRSKTSQSTPSSEGVSEDGSPVTPTQAPKFMYWTAQAKWGIPFKVRYAIAYVIVDERAGTRVVGPLGPWSDWEYSKMPSNPRLELPSVPFSRNTENMKQRIYRQFENEEPDILGDVDLTVEQFTDLHPEQLPHSVD